MYIFGCWQQGEELGTDITRRKANRGLKLGHKRLVQLTAIKPGCLSSYNKQQKAFINFLVGIEYKNSF